MQNRTSVVKPCYLEGENSAQIPGQPTKERQDKHWLIYSFCDNTYKYPSPRNHTYVRNKWHRNLCRTKASHRRRGAWISVSFVAHACMVEWWRGFIRVVTRRINQLLVSASACLVSSLWVVLGSALNCSSSKYHVPTSLNLSFIKPCTYCKMRNALINY